MNTTVEQLRAAKALIDTPEKVARYAWRCRYTNPISWACSLFSNSVRLLRALSAQMPSHPASKGVSKTYAFYKNNSHADIMVLFDRAITAAEQLEVQS